MNEARDGVGSAELRRSQWKGNMPGQGVCERFGEHLELGGHITVQSLRGTRRGGWGEDGELLAPEQIPQILTRGTHILA